ncbi:MAG: extracellular solute-binding protein [Lactobacillaceae bacterium]|nr:extracellular solute-binding protein [Lactobacillaceae bacterium]
MKSVMKANVLAMTTVMLASTAASLMTVTINTPTANAASKVQKLKLWVDTDTKPTYTAAIANFEKANPKIKVTIKYTNSTDALKNLQKDPAAAADVFMFPHDQIGSLAAQGLLYQNTKYAKTLKKSQIASAMKGASYKGKTYGYPYGIETQVLYYNKTQLTTNDIKSWTSITTKGKMGSNLGAAGANYIYGPLFYTAGDTLYGKNGEKAKGTNIDNKKGVSVLKWIKAQKNNAGFVQTSADTLNLLQSGKISATLSGPWSYNDYSKALGDKLGIAPYPTVDLGKGEKQMQAFSGIKLFGVKQDTKYPLAAMKLANYLTSDAVQKLGFENSHYIPTSKAVQKSTEIQNDALAKAVVEMSQTGYSTPMPKSPAMANFWASADAIFNDTYKGKISDKQMLPKLTKMVKQAAKSVK